MSINSKKLRLPDKPGVYFFLGEKKRGRGGVKGGREILYIGKATSLRDRVKSYWREDVIATRGPLIIDMVFNAEKVDYEATDSVLEALILEAALIKKHQPKYNTKEKSDKSFNYVCITKPKRRQNAGYSVPSIEGLPKVVIKRGKNIQQETEKYSAIFGPFTSGAQLREALKIIRPIFPYLDEKTKNYYKFYKQVSLVPDISNEEGIKKYKNNLKHLKLFFEGKKKKVLRDLEKEMKILAKEQKFEDAGITKKQIFALKHINDIALIKDNFLTTKSYKLEAGSRIEAYDVAHMGGKNMVGVMTVMIDGEVEKSEYKKFKIRTQSNANDTGALGEILERRFNHPEWGVPDLIVVDGGQAQVNVAKSVASFRGLKIDVVSVVKDEFHRPREIKGDKRVAKKYEREILLVNSEAHRFAINYHKKERGKNFINKKK